MSKKNNKSNQQLKNGRENVIQLANIALAKTVTVTLPPQIKRESLMLPIMEGYIRLKLKDKKVTLGQSCLIAYLANSYNFIITEIDGIKTDIRSPIVNDQVQQKQQKQTPNGKQSQNVSYIVGIDTQIQIINFNRQREQAVQQVISRQFYGYRQQFDDLKQSVLHSLYHREELIKNGLGPLKGILVGGFSGAGKSALLHELRVVLEKERRAIFWKSISSVEMLSRVVGGAEEFIRNIFADLKKSKPAILAIEDIHLLFGVKEVGTHETVLATLLSELDRLVWEEVVVVATYCSDRELSKNIRSSGKFQKQITMNLPNHTARLQILTGLTQRLQLKQTMTLEGLKKINLRLNGFSVGQIKQILRQAYSHCGRDLTEIKFQDILKNYRPAQIKELIVEVPELYWNQIGGYQSVKKQIKKVVELPLQHSAKFIKFGIQPSKGILLYGPPGCSKTMMAKAIATQSKLNFISIKGPELFSKYVGQSERAIRNIFKRARACSPCVIFFDEIDALASQRSANTDVTDRVLCQLLNEMDGIQGLKEVAIVAATNRPETLDKALLRPGRFDYLIYVSPPDEIARRQIFKIYLSKSVQLEEVHQLSNLMANKTDGYTGAEISLVCREAVLLGLQENIDCQHIELKHLEMSLKRVKKRLTNELIRSYETFSSTIKE